MTHWPLQSSCEVQLYYDTCRGAYTMGYCKIDHLQGIREGQNDDICHKVPNTEMGNPGHRRAEARSARRHIVKGDLDAPATALQQVSAPIDADAPLPDICVALC
jgi:hypothetical protein